VTRIVFQPRSRAGRMSLSSRSPIITASESAQPARSKASLKISGSGALTARTSIMPKTAKPDECPRISTVGGRGHACLGSEIWICLTLFRFGACNTRRGREVAPNIGEVKIGT
jgi:hypothetical protein